MFRPRARVLYIDNDDESCEMLTLTLDWSGIDVTCASGGADALKIASTNAFDLFVMDVSLADGDGNELCKQLRKKFPNCPVVFYSGNASEQDRDQGLRAGAADYICKPNSDRIAPSILQLLSHDSSAGAKLAWTGGTWASHMKLNRLY